VVELGKRSTVNALTLLVNTVLEALVPVELLVDLPVLEDLLLRLEGSTLGLWISCGARPRRVGEPVLDPL
jgi:hypothetical protein